MGRTFSKTSCAAALFAAALFTPALAMAQSGNPDLQLLEAVNAGNAAGVTQALSQGANIEGDEGGMTPLLVAVNGNADVVKVLLEHHANIEAKMKDGMTALGGAVFYNKPEIVKVLLEYHPNTEVKAGMDHETPLGLAASDGRTDIAKMLLEHHANTAVKDNLGHTPLQLATLMGHADTAKLISGYQSQNGAQTAQAQPAAPSSAPPARDTGILALDCGNNTLKYNVWIDTDKSFATVKGYDDGSFPVQITPTSITWRPDYYGSPMEVIIDRTAGTIRWHILPNSSGASMDRTDACARGSTPFPATKF